MQKLAIVNAARAGVMELVTEDTRAPVGWLEKGAAITAQQIVGVWNAYVDRETSDSTVIHKGEITVHVVGKSSAKRDELHRIITDAIADYSPLKLIVTGNATIRIDATTIERQRELYHIISDAVVRRDSMLAQLKDDMHRRGQLLHIAEEGPTDVIGALAALDRAGFHVTIRSKNDGK